MPEGTSGCSWPLCAGTACRPASWTSSALAGRGGGTCCARSRETNPWARSSASSSPRCSGARHPGLLCHDSTRPAAPLHAPLHTPLPLVAGALHHAAPLSDGQDNTQACQRRASCEPEKKLARYSQKKKKTFFGRGCLQVPAALGRRPGAAALVGGLAPGRVGRRRAPGAQGAPPDRLAAPGAGGCGLQLQGPCSEPTPHFSPCTAFGLPAGPPPFDRMHT
jgi:hypothetical protein